MRIWSIHPKYLDVKRLVACWRESLLARKVLENKTKGYKNHSQLIRFKCHVDPVGAINQYLYYIYDEAEKRGYKFNKTKLYPTNFTYKIDVSEGQVNYEAKHLSNKIKTPINCCDIETNPLFQKTFSNEIEIWEKIKP